MPLEDRLLAKRAINVETGCWEWTGCRDPQGYGRVNWAAQTTDTLVHRIAFAVLTERDPGDLLVCHRCDNPPCFNPTHLYLGTVADNNRDTVERGQWSPPPIMPAGHPTRAHGERNGSAKLTEAAVRAAFSDPRPTHVIAAELGVDRTCVNNIKRGASWRHVTAA